MPLILPGNVGSATAGGYDVANSLRFNDASSDFLHITPSSAGNLRTWTFSIWFKRSAITTGAQHKIFATEADANNKFEFYFNTNDTLAFYHYSNNGGTTDAFLGTNQVFRDTAAWYHLVIAVDTTQGTAANRVKMYINGTQASSFSTAIYFQENYDTYINSAEEHRIGANLADAQYFDGYMAEAVLIDGSQLAADQFGEFDSDSAIWKPKDVSGLTFGTNGFYLEFKQTGTSANASGIGADTSGNTNHLTVSNLTAVDQSIDTCTNNFCTLNPLDNFYAATTFSEGNLKAVTSSDNESYNTATIGVASGKWYWEVKIVNSSTNGTYGITDSVTRATNNYLGDDAYDTAYLKDGKVYRDSGYVSGFSNANTLTAYDTGAILMFALDLTNNALYAGHNGTWGNSSDPTSGASKTGAIPIDAVTSTGTGFYFPAFGEWTGSAAATYSVNFGSPEFAISSGNTDGSGFGNFEYAVPSGYFALCTKNLAEYG